MPALHSIIALRARFSPYVEDARSPDFSHAEALVAWCLEANPDVHAVEARAATLARMIAGSGRFIPASELIRLAEPFAAFTEDRPLRTAGGTA